MGGENEQELGCGYSGRYGGFVAHGGFPVLGNVTLLLTFVWNRISSWMSRSAHAYNLALARLRQEVFCKYEASPGYTVSFRPD